MFIYDKNELVIFTDLETPESINYLKKILLDLKYGLHNKYVSKLYYECDKEGRKGRCRRLGKLPFFIYYLSAHESNIWTRANFRNALLGKAILTEKEAEQVLTILDLLREDTYIDGLFKEKTYDCLDIIHIFNRYQRDYKALVERKILESTINMPRMKDAVLSFGKAIENMFDLLPRSGKQLSEIIKDYLDLKYDLILDHIKSEGTVIMSEMYWNNRRFRKIGRKLFEKIVFELEEEGLVSLIKPEHRTYITHNTK